MSEDENTFNSIKGKPLKPKVVTGGETSARDIYTDGGDFIGRDQNIFTEETSYDVSGLPNPYLGLRSFTYDDRGAFAGREQLVKWTVDKWITVPGNPQTLTFITGASGSGKSSFAQAGLIPNLEAHYKKRGKTVRWAVFRPSTNLLAMLADALAQLDPDLYQIDLEKLSTTGFSDHLGENTRSDHVNLLVIDQFEELFIDADPQKCQQFIELISNLGTFENIRTHFIATLRSDYLKEISEIEPLWELASRGIVVRAMSTEEMKEAIQRPLQIKAERDERYREKRFEPGLVEKLAQEASQEATYLPLLQVTLEELWRNHKLKQVKYQGLTSAISQRADQVYQFNDYNDSVPQDERPQQDRDEILNIFLDLVSVSLDDNPKRDVRRSRTRQDLEAVSPRRKKLIDDLIQARLLSVHTENITGEFGEVEYVNIIHDSLIHNWTLLTDSIKDERDLLKQRTRFRADLADWRAHQGDEKYLLPDSRLEDARRLLEMDDVEIQDKEARKFVLKSIDKKDAQQRRQTLVASLVAAGLFFLLVMAIVAGVFAWQQSLISRSRELAALALNQIPVDLERAVLIAIEANQVRHTFESEDALRQVLGYHQPNIILNGHEDSVISAQFSRDGERVVTASEDGTARVWNAESGEEIIVLGGNESDVNSAQFSPDGEKVVTANDKGKVRVLDASSGEEIIVMDGQGHVFNSAKFSPDGARVLAASDDYAVWVWDAASGEQVAMLSGPEVQITSAQFSPNGEQVVTASVNGTARVWDISDEEAIVVLGNPEDWVVGAQFSPDGEWVVITYLDRTVRVWDASGVEVIAVLRGHEDDVTFAQFSPDGARVVTTSLDDTARVWDASDGEVIAELRGHEDDVTSAQFSLDGERVVTASRDGTARVWDAANGKLIYELRGHNDWVTSAQFSPDGKRVLTSGRDSTARVWDPAGGTGIAELRVYGYWIFSAQFSPDGERLVTVSDDGTMRVWDTTSWEPIAELGGHEYWISSAQFSPDGERVVTVSDDYKAQVWDVASGEAIAVLGGEEYDVTSAQFSPDGERVVTSSDYGTARVWEFTSGEEFIELSGHQDYVTSAQFSPGGEQVVTTSEDGTARVWDAASGKTVAVLDGDEYWIYSAQFSPDSVWVVTTSDDGIGRVWDTASEEEIAMLGGDEYYVKSARFSPDGKRVVTVCNDGKVLVWNAASEKAIAVLRGHEKAVNSAQFSPDGARVATASLDETARVWDSASGEELTVLRGHEYSVDSAHFSPDGMRVLTTGEDGTARIYALNIADLISVAKSRLNRELTCDERVQFLNENLNCPE